MSSAAYFFLFCVGFVLGGFRFGFGSWRDQARGLSSVVLGSVLMALPVILLPIIWKKTSSVGRRETAYFRLLNAIIYNPSYMNEVQTFQEPSKYWTHVEARAVEEIVKSELMSRIGRKQKRCSNLLQCKNRIGDSLCGKLTRKINEESFIEIEPQRPNLFRLLKC